MRLLLTAVEEVPAGGSTSPSYHPPIRDTLHPAHSRCRRPLRRPAQRSTSAFPPPIPKAVPCPGTCGWGCGWLRVALAATAALRLLSRSTARAYIASAHRRSTASSIFPQGSLQWGEL